MAGRRKAHLHVPDPDRLAQPGLLPRITKRIAVADGHDAQGLGRGQHAAVAGPRMVGVAVGDQRAGHRPGRIDVEAPERAVQAFAGEGEEVAGACRHFFGVRLGAIRRGPR